MMEIIHNAAGTLIALCAFASIVWGVEKYQERAKR